MGSRLPIPEKSWHESKSGCWFLSLGVRGMKVPVYQQQPGGVFHRAYRVPGRGLTYASLVTRDRSRARELEKGLKPAPAEPLTLERLWTRYRQEAPGYRQNFERTRRQKGAEVRLLTAGFGRGKRIDHLTRNDVDRYVAMRRTGHGWPNGATRRAVRARTIHGEKDAATLYTCYQQATPDGMLDVMSSPVKLRDKRVSQQCLGRVSGGAEAVKSYGTLIALKNTRSATRLIRASRFELPLLGSNQDSPDPEPERWGDAFRASWPESVTCRAWVPADYPDSARVCPEKR